MSASHYDVVTVGGGLGGAAWPWLWPRPERASSSSSERRSSKIGYVGNSCRRGAWQRRSSSPLQICFAKRARRALRGDGIGPPAYLRSTTPQGVPAIGVSHPEMQEFCFKLLPVPAPTSVAKRLSRLSRQDELRECRSNNRAVSRDSFRAPCCCSRRA